MTQVTLEDLVVRYEGQEKPALNGINLEIADGKLTALLGPSGCGKTTMMKLIAGLIRQNRGDILFDGESVLGIPAEKRDTAMVFQKHLLFPYMSVGDNIAFGLRQRGIDKVTRRKRVGEMLEFVHLPGMESRRPGQLSGGQQQRVALARALIIEPKVLLLDEPLSALDAHLRDEMRELISDIQRRTGITTLVVTHDQDEAVVLADTIAVMFDGDIHQIDSPNVFYEKPASPRVAKFFGTRNLLDAQLANGVAITGFGRLVIGDGQTSDGPSTIAIRPEEIRLGEGQNSFEAQVASRLYLGDHVRAKFDLDGTTLEGLFPKSFFKDLVVGNTVRINLPHDSIWAMRKS